MVRHLPLSQRYLVVFYVYQCTCGNKLFLTLNLNLKFGRGETHAIYCFKIFTESRVDRWCYPSYTQLLREQICATEVSICKKKQLCDGTIMKWKHSPTINMMSYWPPIALIFNSAISRCQLFEKPFSHTNCAQQSLSCPIYVCADFVTFPFHIIVGLNLKLHLIWSYTQLIKWIVVAFILIGPWRMWL